MYLKGNKRSLEPYKHTFGEEGRRKDVGEAMKEEFGTLTLTLSALATGLQKILWETLV